MQKGDTVDIDLNKVKVLPSIKPEKAKEKSVMNYEVTIENSAKQKLKKLRPFEGACLRIPSSLSNEGQIVCQLLFSCFEKQGTVQEGQVKDLIWGFAQIDPPIPPKLTVKGLRDLTAHGMIKLQFEGGEYAHFLTGDVTEAFIRYTNKLLDMVFEPIISKK